MVVKAKVGRDEKGRVGKVAGDVRTELRIAAAKDCSKRCEENCKDRAWLDVSRPAIADSSQRKVKGGLSR